MNKNPLSTYKVLMDKSLNHDLGQSLIDWGIEMIEAGFESENLFMLAGKTKPYNQFELQELLDKVLKDFNLDHGNKDIVVRNYIRSIIVNSVNKPDTYFETLQKIKDICIDLGLGTYGQEYNDFYLLYFAKENLIESPVQWYWDGANRENIDEIIEKKFKEFERTTSFNN
jgi:hypothetical protein